MYFFYKIFVVRYRDIAVFENQNPNGSQLPVQVLSNCSILDGLKPAKVSSQYEREKCIERTRGEVDKHLARGIGNETHLVLYNDAIWH